MSNKTNTATKQVKEEVQTGVENIVPEIQETVGNYTDKASEKANEYARLTAQTAKQVGQRAAEVLNSSTEYIKNLDLDEARKQVTNKVKKQPELSLAIVAIFGILIGLLLGKKSR
jgi:ElaB/YqjD/DUF883 family membrane-anchored ribosome-binding protein